MRHLVLIPLVLLAGCSELPTTAPADDLDPQLAKRGGGSTLLGGVHAGDAGLDPLQPAVLASTCGGAVSTQWHINYGHTECLIVRAAWTSTSYQPYELRDDVRLIMRVAKGKNGRITHVKLLAQDVIGDAGIAHETDDIAVAVPVSPSKRGFVLHVHATAVPVWRLSGHTGGDRVEIVGTVDIGDIEYR